jgi:hypothetical protein
MFDTVLERADSKLSFDTKNLNFLDKKFFPQKNSKGVPSGVFFTSKTFCLEMPCFWYQMKAYDLKS